MAPLTNEATSRWKAWLHKESGDNKPTGHWYVRILYLPCFPRSFRENCIVVHKQSSVKVTSSYVVSGPLASTLQIVLYFTSCSLLVFFRHGFCPEHHTESLAMIGDIPVMVFCIGLSTSNWVLFPPLIFRDKYIYHNNGTKLTNFPDPKFHVAKKRDKEPRNSGNM